MHAGGIPNIKWSGIDGEDNVLVIELLLKFDILIYFRVEIFSYDFIYKNFNTFFYME